MKEFMGKIEDLMDFGVVKKDIIFLCISGAVLFQYYKMDKSTF